MKGTAVCIGLISAMAALHAVEATEIIPPSPAHYFNDYAGIVSQSSAAEFDRQLMQFMAATSNQVVVAVFQKMQSDDDIAAYTQRVAESWAVGQKDKRNGVVLFVFVQDRKMIIQVGYGLEGALPDIVAFNITEYQMKPQFAAGNYEAGLRTGINSIFKAIRGEYTATKPAVQEIPRHHHNIAPLLLLVLSIPISLLFGLHRTATKGVHISSKGTHWTIDWGQVVFFWLNLILSSSSRSSSGSSSSNGGFRGAGGSFGGGGAGSSW